MNIYIGNLNYRVREEDLKQVMEDYGVVDSVKIIKDRETGKSKGFAFVEMPDDAAAKKAIESATTDFINIKLKSKKWKEDGTYSAITAKVKIEENGSEVSYTPGKLQDFVGNKK